MSGTIYKSYTMLTNPPDGFTVSIDPSSLTISQQVLFAAPPPIGSTTPNTGAFTTLSSTTPITPASGGTGSNAIPGAGSLLIGNSSGSYTVNQLTAGSGINITNASGAITISGASTGSSFTRTTITATGGQTTFSVSYGVGSIQVYLNGVMLAPADYTATSGTSVVLAVAAAAGDIFDAFSFTPQNITGVVPQANGGTGVSNASLTPITATGSTTARTLGDRAADFVNVQDFGAVGNAGVSGAGAHDDGPAFQAANDYLASVGGGIIHYGSKRYLIDTPVTLSRNVSIQGPTGRADPGNPFGVSTAFFLAMQTCPALIINSSAYISRSSSSGLTNVYAFRKGMALDGTDLPGAFAGTAFSTPSGVDAVYVSGCSVIGFGYAFYDTNSARAKFNDVLIDCNNGIVDLGAGDVNYYTDVHCYGVTQSGATGHQTFSNRSGNAFFFGTNSVNGPVLDGCFAYSYAVGFELDVPGSYTITDCWVDGTSDAVTGLPLVARVGLALASSGAQNAEPQIQGFKAAAQGTAFRLDAGNYGVIQLANVIIWASTVGLNVSASNLNATNLVVRGYFNDGIVFNTVAAANSAFFVNLEMYDRYFGAVDVNCGGGLPAFTNASYFASTSNGYINGILGVVNEAAPTITPSNPIVSISWAATSGGQVTFITVAPHGLSAGGSFTTSGCTPSGYNSTFTAIAGTTGNTLVAALVSNPGVATVLGTVTQSFIVFPNGKTFAYITGTGPITGIFPIYDSLTINIQFISANSTLSGPFRLSAAFTASAGSNITLRYDRAAAQWYEVARAV